MGRSSGSPSMTLTLGEDEISKMERMNERYLHSVKEVGSPMLAIERLDKSEESGNMTKNGFTDPGNHGVDGGEVGLAVRTTVDAFT